jgi:hypothetical protein
MTAAVDPPSLGLDVADLVDWLELTALFSDFGIARLDAMAGALYQLEETAEDDIGQRDREREKLVEQLENEVELRRLSLGDAYPFSLNDTCEELTRVENWKHNQYTFYLVCLLTTHITGSAILRLPPIGDLLTRLRNQIFQIIATLGLAGLSTGPALSVGWPRRTGESIIQLLTRAANAGAGFTVRNPPGQYIPPQQKDGGIDVIAWTSETVPPPTAFYFAQAATGKNWPVKSVNDHSRVFSQAYMQDHMTGNRISVTLIPFRILDDAFWQSQHQLHMAILDRLRLPAKALQGLKIANQGTQIDEADKVADLISWLDEYINYALNS